MSNLEPTHRENEPKLFLSDSVYNALKFMAQIFLPAVGTFYFALAATWGLPKAEEVVGTIVAVDTLLGVLLGLSTRVYNNSEASHDGVMDVEQLVDGSKVFSLSLNEDPEILESKKSITFKVNPS